MKNIVTKTAALLLALAMLAACGKKDENDAQSAPSASASGAGASSAPSSSASLPASSLASSSDSASVAPPPADMDATQWPVGFVTILPEGEKEYILLEMHVPPEWKFDGYSVFSSGEYKAAEVIDTVRKGNDEALYPTSLTSRYEVKVEGLPDGLGLLSSTDMLLGEANARLYTFKTQPHDADKPWFNYYYLLECDDYIVNIGFFSETEADTALYESVLKTAKLYV